MDQYRVLGLDISSSVIGWAIMEMPSITLIGCGFIKPKKPDIEEIVRLNDVYEQIFELCKKYNTIVSSVEDIFIFMKNRSSARTITVLTAFNRVCSLATFHAGCKVNMYSVHEIRKTISKKYNIGKIEKLEMPSIIKQYLDKDFKIIINKKNNVAKETFDIADAVAAAWCHCIQKGDK
jgi:Holliday junction resolvasome RuvABC endonuclease subunit